MTQKNAVKVALSVLSNDAQYTEACEALTMMLTAMERKTSKPSKASVENAVLATEWVEALPGVGRYATASEMAEAMGVTVSKATAILTLMVENGTAEREKVGKVWAYSAKVGE